MPKLFNMGTPKTNSTLAGARLRGSIAVTCGAAFLLFGYDQGVFGAVVSLPSFRLQFNDPSPNLEGIFAAIYDIGCFVGCIVAFLGAERFGRKGSLMWGTWIMVIGTILQASAYESVQMIISRIAMLVIQSALIAFGHPLSTFMGLASSQAEPSGFSWRWPIAFQGAFCVIILMVLPWLPESPRWLVAHDRPEEAQDIFARLAGQSGMPVDHPYVVDQLHQIKENVAEEQRIGEATWAEVFTEGKLRNVSRVLLGAGPYLFNQWSGINSLAYFLPITFERNIGLSRQLSLILAGVLGLQYFLVSWLPYFFMDRVGRRTLLIWSSAACSVCMIMIAAMLYVNTLPAQWVFVAFCFIFFDVFSWGILPVSWMYAAEIMPLRTRNKGVALGVSTHWLSNFVVVYVTPQAIENLGYQLYIIWAVFNASFVPITWFFYPETARRSLEEVDQIFLTEKFGITHTRKPAPKRPRGSIAAMEGNRSFKDDAEKEQVEVADSTAAK
ncbi:hypothetical protein LTR70_010753 [Exophiala xenobiotica]|nr:hypothetical protein LTR70_010753 [Exophiala xenobiotica]